MQSAAFCFNRAIRIGASFQIFPPADGNYCLPWSILRSKPLLAIPHIRPKPLANLHSLRWMHSELMLEVLARIAGAKWGINRSRN
jgi:hypothetical protein